MYHRQLIDSHAVAEILELQFNSVSGYQRRYPDMPRPVVDMGRGRCKLWNATEVERWAAARTFALTGVTCLNDDCHVRQGDGHDRPRGVRERHAVDVPENSPASAPRLVPDPAIGDADVDMTGRAEYSWLGAVEPSLGRVQTSSTGGSDGTASQVVLAPGPKGLLAPCPLAAARGKMDSWCRGCA